MSREKGSFIDFKATELEGGEKKVCSVFFCLAVFWLFFGWEFCLFLVFLAKVTFGKDPRSSYY